MINVETKWKTEIFDIFEVFKTSYLKKKLKLKIKTLAQTTYFLSKKSMKNGNKKIWK